MYLVRYEKLVHLNLSRNELGKATGGMLKELLWSEACSLQHLDLSSNHTLDGYDIAAAVKRNQSLTSIDLRDIPTANTDQVYDFFASFLLQDENRCRLGLLSCDAFQVSEGLEQLSLGGAPTRTPCFKLLAGVLKYNRGLRRLTLSDTGFDGVAASFFHTALTANAHLEHLDLSSNPIAHEEDLAGISLVAQGVAAHPVLQTLKLDGAALPIAELRGAAGAAERLDAHDWHLGRLSGHVFGVLARQNRTRTELDLRSDPDDSLMAP